MSKRDEIDDWNEESFSLNSDFEGFEHWLGFRVSSSIAADVGIMESACLSYWMEEKQDVSSESVVSE